MVSETFLRCMFRVAAVYNICWGTRRPIGSVLKPRVASAYDLDQRFQDLSSGRRSLMHISVWFRRQSHALFTTA